MLRRLAIAHQQRRLFHATRAWRQASSIISVQDGTFFRSYPAPTDTPESNPPLFKKLNFSLPTGLKSDEAPEYWAIISPSSLARTTFLQILAGRHFCDPPIARTYPYLAEISASPHSAVKYVGFDADRGSGVGGNNVRGAYLSARYEARREETDYSLLDYLTGHTELNAIEHETSPEEKESLEKVINQLNLRSLLSMPVANLSNGQTRRARIAKALMARPEVLLLDGPFMGLDPNTSATIGKVLHNLAQSQSPRLIMSLRPEDGIPTWITHLVITDTTSKILDQGSKQSLLLRNASNHKITSLLTTSQNSSKTTYLRSKDAHPYTSPALPPGEPLIQMSGVQIKYASKTVLGNWHQTNPSTNTPYPTPGLHWSLHRGQRTAIFGPNGSGKTTLLSLITSDHPQTYSQPILHFSRSRLPAQGEPGISLFDLQSRIGHSSPEIHAFFPKHLSVRQVLESAWADTPLSKPRLTAARDRVVDATLRWFARELNPWIGEGEKTSQERVNEGCSLRLRTSSKREGTVREVARRVWNEVMFCDEDLGFAEIVRFRDLSFSSQRLALFLRALVAAPDLVILDEALSGVDAGTRDKALLWLSQGERVECVEGALAVLSVQARLSEGEENGKVVFKGLEDRQALVVIAHEKADVPGCVRDWICLPQGEEEGVEPRVGVLDGPLELRPEAWEGEIWGTGDKVGEGEKVEEASA